MLLMHFLADVKQNMQAMEKGLQKIEIEMKAEAAHPSSAVSISHRQAAFEATLHAASEHHKQAAETQSPFMSMLLDFHSEILGKIEELKTLAQQAEYAQDTIVQWMGEQGSSDAPEVLKSLLTFCRSFDLCFARVFQSVGIDGIKAHIETIRREWNAM